MPWLVIALLEVTLRLAHYGDAYPLFVPYQPEPAFLFPNEQVGRRYFHGAFVPSTRLDFFHAQKPAGSVRLVFQGESSAAGFPYGHGGAPSRMLEQRLQTTFPDRAIEVVNTALTAISSYVLLDQADEIVALHPDAVLIYTGHNEYYGVLGAASTTSLGHARPFVLAYLQLRHFRAVQLLERLFLAGGATLRGPQAAENPGTVMELMAGGQRVPLGSARYEDGIAQFRANLDELLARYQAAHIPAYVGTLVSNERDQPPFISGFAPGADSAAWRRSVADAQAALQRGDSAAAEDALVAATRIDSTAADAFFALGRLHEARGDTAMARAAFRAAKEGDELRFRAPEAMNSIIRDVARKRGATVVETERAVERASPGEIPGHTLILEHLHPNVDGYFAIADAFYEALRAHGAFAPWPTSVVTAAEARRVVPVTAVDSLAAVLRVDRLTAGWPFQPHGVTRAAIADTLHPRTTVDSLALGLVQGATPWVEATDRLRMYYERAGDAERAIHVALVMAQEYRYSAQPYLDAARIALAAGADSAALRYAVAANARRETAASAELVGLLLLRQGNGAAAVPQLERAAQLAPGDRAYTAPLAAARILPYLEAGRARAPGDTSVLLKLATAYVMTQQYGRARETLGTLHRLAPGSAAAGELRRQLPP
jgi:tetratricopeptide (TPR) repeat protein